MDLIERLTAVEGRENSHGLCTNWHRNPDGPEAAKVITQARAEIARLREAGLQLALAAGKLNVALDGVEKFKRHRQNVLVAMDSYRAALKDTTQ